MNYNDNLEDIDADYEYELKVKDKKIEELEEEIEHLNELLGRDTKKKEPKGNNEMPIYFSSSLFDAITADSLENVQYLVEHGSDLEARDSKQRTPLHLAVSTGDPKIVEYLSQNGSQFEVFDADGLTPFFYAVKYDYVPIAQILYKYGARANNIKIGDKSISPIEIAVKNISISMLKFLTETCKCDINYPLYNDATLFPLSYSIKNDDSRIALFLIGSGSNLKQYIYENSERIPILHYCIRKDMRDIALELIKKGANFEEREKNGFTPLLTSMKYHRNCMIYCALINKGANIEAKDNEMKTPLIIAFEELYSLRLGKMSTGCISALISKGANTLPTIKKYKNKIMSDSRFKDAFRNN